MIAAAEWTALAGLSRRELPGHPGPGVYTFRDGRTGEVLYIGQSGDVRRRLRDYRDGGVSTRGRIHALLYPGGWSEHIEIAVEACDLPRSRERELLDEHYDAHGALPAWNRRAS